MADDRTPGIQCLLHGVPSPDHEEGSRILSACPTVDIGGGAPRLESAFAGAALLLAAEGFAVVRAPVGAGGRSVVTCEAEPGTLLLPPSADEELVGLGSSRVLVIDFDARRRLLQMPSVAERIVDQLALGARQRREATANFALTRHGERVRRKLLQLGRVHGHVVRDGVRIDFPVSHALLGEMIGSSRETVTRAVDELQRAGFVARSGSTYRLLAQPRAAEGDGPHTW